MVSFYLPGYKVSEQCLPCHDLVVRDVEAEITFTEWDRIPGFSMFGGIPCQDCHMPEKEYDDYQNKFNINVEASQIMQIVNHHGFDYWRVQNAANLEFEWDRDLVDLSYDSTKKHKYLFYAAFEAIEGIPPTFSEEIHDAM